MISETVFDKIGSNLQKAREKKGLTLASLSKKCGIAESNLCSYESGNSMTLKTLIKIVTALGVTFDSILSDSKTIYFEDGKSSLNTANVANAIEYLFNNNILVRKRIPEEYPSQTDIYIGENAESFIEPAELESTRISSDSSPYNAVIIRYPYSKAVLRYISCLEKSINFINSETEKEALYKIQKSMLINEMDKFAGK